jgi:hypothetical protein
VEWNREFVLLRRVQYDLVVWLRAQLDEDERVARAAGVSASGSRWHVADRGAVIVRGDDGMVVVFDEGSPSGEEAEHIARWDPARVLAEVDAKRRILDVHPGDDEVSGQVFCGDGIGLVGCKWAYPCPTIRLLALPFADRPGYRAEWRP